MRDPNRTAARASIAREAANLAPDATMRMPCPFCGGGKHKDDSFFVTRSPEGGCLLYICHRASCQEKGAIKSGPPGPPARRAPRPPTIWAGSFKAELGAYGDIFASAVRGPYRKNPAYYGLHGTDADDKVVWILRDVNGQRIGVQERRITEGGKRVHSWKETSKALYSYYPGGTDLLTVIVEDCLSAAAISAWNVPAVALLGTVLHPQVRDDLLSLMTQEYLIALDPGAEDAAALVKSALMCYTTRPITVAYLPKDFKNMTKKQQQRTLDKVIG